MKIYDPDKYHMLVSAGLHGEFQVKLVTKEGSLFRILFSATSTSIPPLEWLIWGYKQIREQYPGSCT